MSTRTAPTRTAASRAGWVFPLEAYMYRPAVVVDSSTPNAGTTTTSSQTEMFTPTKSVRARSLSRTRSPRG